MLVWLPFLRSPAIGTTTSGPYPGAPIGALAVGATADDAEIEDADLAHIDAETDAEIDPDADAADPGDDDADLSDDPGDDLADEADAEASVGDPALRYLPPLAAAKWLKSQGLDVDVAMLRRMVAGGQGPAVGHFSGRLGGWRVRFDQLEQWAEWERFRASWQTRPRAAA